jgi:hypothetical protein
LLIKALFKRDASAKVLETCLLVSNQLTGIVTDELLIQSEVIEEDKNALREIVLDIAPGNTKISKLSNNFKFFLGKIDDWIGEHTSEEFDKLKKNILYNVVLLPIECDSEDDALTIFETINNRGMPLSDADIFKAKLYHNVPVEQQSAFISDWTHLRNPDWLFRVYMHIIRAENDNVGKEISLRAFFAPKKILVDWQKVIASLKKINSIDSFNFSLDNNCSEISFFWALLEIYTNQYWKFPLYVFLHKKGTYNDLTSFSLSAKYISELTTLIEEMVRYYFIKGLVYNAVNTVKDTTYKVCAKISNGEDYLDEYRLGITANDKVELTTRLKSGEFGRYQKGLVLLASYLNPKQDKVKFAELVRGKYDIEHILPKKWNNFDGWTESSWEEWLNTLGNLMPLEREINISASNEFLKRKKAKYKESKVRDAKDIFLTVADNGWTPAKVKKMLAEKLSRLYSFLALKNNN